MWATSGAGCRYPSLPSAAAAAMRQLEGEKESEIRPHFNEIDFRTQPVKVTGSPGLQ